MSEHQKQIEVIHRDAAMILEYDKMRRTLFDGPNLEIIKTKAYRCARLLHGILLDSHILLVARLFDQSSDCISLEQTSRHINKNRERLLNTYGFGEETLREFNARMKAMRSYVQKHRAPRNSYIAHNDADTYAGAKAYQFEIGNREEHERFLENLPMAVVTAAECVGIQITAPVAIQCGGDVRTIVEALRRLHERDRPV